MQACKSTHGHYQSLLGLLVKFGSHATLTRYSHPCEQKTPFFTQTINHTQVIFNTRLTSSVSQAACMIKSYCKPTLGLPPRHYKSFFCCVNPLQLSLALQEATPVLCTVYCAAVFCPPKQKANSPCKLEMLCTVTTHTVCGIVTRLEKLAGSGTEKLAHHPGIEPLKPAADSPVVSHLKSVRNWPQRSLSPPQSSAVSQYVPSARPPHSTYSSPLHMQC